MFSTYSTCLIYSFGTNKISQKSCPLAANQQPLSLTFVDRSIHLNLFEFTNKHWNGCNSSVGRFLIIELLIVATLHSLGFKNKGETLDACIIACITYNHFFLIFLNSFFCIVHIHNNYIIIRKHFHNSPLIFSNNINK